MAHQMWPRWLWRRRLLVVVCALAVVLSLALSACESGPLPFALGSPTPDNPCVIQFGEAAPSLPDAVAPRTLTMVPPVAANGVVYVDYPVLTTDRTQTQYTIAALRASDGVMLWSVPDINYRTSEITYVDGKLILLNGGNLAVLRATDGTTLWQRPFVGSLWRWGQMYRDGVLYIANAAADGVVISAFRLADGRVLWQTPVSGISSQPALVLDGNSLYIGVGAGDIAALRRDTGAIRWQVPIDSAQSNDSTPLAMIGGKLLIYAPGGDVFLNPANGDVEEDAPLPIGIAHRVDLLTIGGTSFVGLSAIADGPPTVNGETYSLYSLFASDGRLVWRASLDSPFASSMIAYAADSLYLGPGPSYFYALNMSDGAVRWSLRPDLGSISTFRASGFAAIPGYFFETADGASTPCTPIDSHLPAIRALSSADGRVIWEDTFSVALGPPSCAVCHAR